MKKKMKRPNGKGSIIKLKGNLRKPYAVRVTLQTEVPDDLDLSYSPKLKRLYIGYTESYDEAVKLLADYLSNPIDLNYKKITFRELFEMYWKKKLGTISKSSENAYLASFQAMHELHDRYIAELKTEDFEKMFQHSDKNYPTLRKMKYCLNQMFDYAEAHDMIYKNYTKYITLSSYHEKNPNSVKRDIFKTSEIKKIWKYKDGLYKSIVLILIYTGLRISELLDLKRCDVHIEERYIEVKQSKTESGIRLVPICDKILPLVKRWNDYKKEYLIFNTKGKKMNYKVYRESYWDSFMNELGLSQHRPHDTRHTCASLMASASVPENIQKKILGHKAYMSFTLKVYTKFEMGKLLEEINKI